jgi:hypothetical protein
MKNCRLVVCLAVAALVVSGCAETDPLDVDSPVFAGLDQAVVEEVLDNPAATQKINEEPESTRASMAQGIVRNFLVCRDAYETYEGWITTGIRPELAPLPTPDNPEEPSNGDWATAYSALEDRVASGESDQLREWLTAEGSCGAWIPADPDQADGPTIRDAIDGER